MEKVKIMDEIAIWKKIKETNDASSIEIVKINDEIKKIECKLLSYVLKKYNSPELLATLKEKKIIDDNGELINAKGIKLTNKTLNFGCLESNYYINPDSAMMLYGAYLEFSDGIINNNIRQELDYKNMTNADLYKLNPYELIYWCYINDITFTEFAKMNFIHECSHRFGIQGGEESDDPYLFNVFSEGVTELIARDFAKENNMRYIPIFRNTELELIDYFFEKELEEIKSIAVSWDNSYNVIIQSLFYLFNIGDNEKLSFNEKWLIIEKALGVRFEVCKERKKNGTEINSSDSFTTIFNKLALRKEKENIIERTEEAITACKLKEMN